MVSQNIAAAFLTKPVEKSKEVQNRANKTDNSFPQFKDTLNTAVDKTYSKKTHRNIAFENKADFRVKDGQQRQIRSFKEAVRESRHQVDEKKDVETDSISTSFKDEDIKSEETKTQKVKENVMEEALAKVLGISQEELRSLMTKLNIKPSELTDTAKTEVISQKISDYLGLSSDEGKTLSKILTLTQKEVESSVKNIKASFEIVKPAENKKSKEDWVKFEGTDVEVVVEDKPAADKPAEGKELGAKIGAALKVLESKLQQEPERLVNQISSKVEEALVDNIEVVDNNTSEIAGDTDEQVLVNADEGADKKVEEKASSQKSSDNEDSAGKEEQSSREVVVTSRDNRGSETKIEESNGTQFEFVSNDSTKKVSQQVEVEKVHSKVPVTKKEIVEQVVEKAKVVLSGDKSEMIIDLKPDHLGKLALKVVTERGIVVAKFVAENEQVKAALESNMNMLKESLEKQGFSVQGFSVSVGDNKQRGFGRENMPKNNMGRGLSKEKLPVSGMVSVENLHQTSRRMNPYSFEESSINITA